MGGREFNVWFQEWSQYEHCSQVDEATKMYAFRKNLNPSLHQKIIQITPQPTTLAALIDKARNLDRNWHSIGDLRTSPKNLKVHVVIQMLRSGKSSLKNL
jgi:hypothetical protein